jgi:hypothetical protein
VFAGASVAVALWVLLQMIGMGAGLAAVSLDDAGSLRSVGIGTTVWTFIAPLLALFAGGVVAGRLATTYDARVGAMHGLISGAVASVLGIVATVSMVGMLTQGGRYIPTRGLLSEDMRVDPDLRAAEVQEATDHAGKLLLGGGISLLFALGASVGGGVLVTRRPGSKRRRRTTAEVPVVPPPPEPPADAPHVTVT